MHQHQGACPVVTIETKNGPVEINESDFDPAKHKLYKADKSQAAAASGDNSDDDAGEDTGHGLKVKGADKKWLVVDKEGKQVGTEKYATKADAQAFIDLLHPPAAPAGQQGGGQ